MKTKFKILIALIIIPFVLLILGILQYLAVTPDKNIPTQKITFENPDIPDKEGVEKIGEIANCIWPAFSPNSYHFACLTHGDEQKIFRWVEFPIALPFMLFCNEGRTDSLFCNSSSKLARLLSPANLLMLDGKKIAAYTSDETGKYYNIDRYGLIFSSNNKHFAYKAMTRINEHEKYTLILDGEEINNFRNDLFGTFSFSADGEHHVYIADEKGKSYIVLDGKNVGEYMNIVDSPFLSSDGKHLAYTYETPSHLATYLSVDDQEKGSFDYLRDFTFSPDGQHYAFISGGKTIIRDNQKSENFNKVSLPIFSPDSQHLAYTAEKEKKVYIIIDNEIKKEFEPIQFPEISEVRSATAAELKFTPDSQHLSFVIREFFPVDKSKWDHSAKDIFFIDGDSKYESVIGEPFYESKNRGDIRSSVFSLNNQHFAFVVWPNKIILDGRELEGRYDVVYNLHLSSNGDYLIYNAVKDNSFYRVVEKIQ